MDKVRVLRILEYVGDRKWVEETLKGSSVPLNGMREVGKECVVKSAIIDQFPETLEYRNDNE